MEGMDTKDAGARARLSPHGSEPRADTQTLGNDEVGLLREQVVVVVVVQDAEAVAVGDGGHEQVDRREAVVADAGELVLGVEGAGLDLGVDAKHGSAESWANSSACSAALRAE